MKSKIKSIRPFIGAKDYNVSRQFYKDFGFEEIVISEDMSYFKKAEFGFYLQNYYAKKWVDNTMLFLEVEDLDTYYKFILNLELDKKYKNVRVSKIEVLDWGSEFFVHDPSGF